MKPIIFNTEIVKAILEGRKTVTRRPVEPQPFCPKAEIKEGTCGYWKVIPRYNNQFDGNGVTEVKLLKSPFGQIGDILWVREPAKVKGWYYDDNSLPPYIQYFYSDEETGNIRLPERFSNKGSRPQWVDKLQGVPNGCLKEMARIFLEITDIRVERVRDITEEQAKKEGIGNKEVGEAALRLENPLPESALVGGFAQTWNSIYNNWHNNPWVWVVEFNRVDN